MWKTTLVFKVTLVYQIFSVFVKLDRNIMKLGTNIMKLHMKFYGLFYVKNEVSGKNLAYFFIILWHSFTVIWRKNVAIFLIFWHLKIKLSDGFIHKTDMKLWNRQIRSGKKIETDGRGEGACRQFKIIFLTEFGGFIISCQFDVWNHLPV